MSKLLKGITNWPIQARAANDRVHDLAQNHGVALRSSERRIKFGALAAFGGCVIFVCAWMNQASASQYQVQGTLKMTDYGVDGTAPRRSEEATTVELTAEHYQTTEQTFSFPPPVPGLTHVMDYRPDYAANQIPGMTLAKFYKTDKRFLSQQEVLELPANQRKAINFTHESRLSQLPVPGRPLYPDRLKW